MYITVETSCGEVIILLLTNIVMKRFNLQLVNNSMHVHFRMSTKKKELYNKSLQKKGNIKSQFYFYRIKI